MTQLARRLALTAALALAPLGLALAQEAAAPPAPSTTIIVAPQKKPPPIDLSPIIDPLIQVIGSLLGLGALYAGSLLLKTLNLNNNKLAQAIVSEALPRAIGYATVRAREEMRDRRWTADTHSVFLNTAGNYAVQKFPDALKQAGVTFAGGEITEEGRQRLHDMIDARLGESAIEAAKAAGDAHPVAAAAVKPVEPQPA